MMWYWLGAFALLIILLFILPSGVSIRFGTGTHRVNLIIAGILIKARIPVTPRVPRSVLRPFRRKHGHVPHEAKPEPEPEDLNEAQRLKQEAREEFWRDVARHMIWPPRRFFSFFRFSIRDLRVRIATPDPAITGMIYGFSWAVAGFIPDRFIPDPRIEVDFEERKTEVEGSLRMTIIPYRAVTVFARALLLTVRARRQDRRKI